VDLRLREGSAAVDAGIELPGITDGFQGRAPDLGAYELGAPPITTARANVRIADRSPSYLQRRAGSCYE
jgi:hypothetical protein